MRRWRVRVLEHLQQFISICYCLNGVCDLYSFKGSSKNLSICSATVSQQYPDYISCHLLRIYQLQITLQRHELPITLPLTNYFLEKGGRKAGGIFELQAEMPNTAVI